MNKKLIVGILSSIVLVTVLTATWFFFFTSGQQSTVPSAGNSSPQPSSDGFTPASTTYSGSSNIAVPGLNGGSVTVSDFIHNGVTIPDAANNGQYLLAGNLGYCVTDTQQCQAGTATDFNIFYNSTDGSFTIALLKEPLGQVRIEAEQFLMTTLGITQDDMCRLNYYVGTTSNVNPLYSGQNLGFSFCPGTTVLPQ